MRLSEPPVAPALTHRRRIVSVGLLVAAGLLPPVLGGCSRQPDPLRVELDEGRRLFESRQVIMFDIREHDEHATGVANGARLLPMSQLQQRLGEIPKDPAQPVLIICNTQNRSSKVVEAMKEAGWDNVRYVHGGMSAWAKNGWPMVRPFGLPRS
ncbi:MAG: rhodanese-like domain-containing protein [Burkholderiales bacterium]|nr:MAG: rhodanese-like domain-containing protein [Burkholderiales bacterium]